MTLSLPRLSTLPCTCEVGIYSLLKLISAIAIKKQQICKQIIKSLFVTLRSWFINTIILQFIYTQLYLSCPCWQSDIKLSCMHTGECITCVDDKHPKGCKLDVSRCRAKSGKNRSNWKNVMSGKVWNAGEVWGNSRAAGVSFQSLQY